MSERVRNHAMPDSKVIRGLIVDIGGVLVLTENRTARRRWETRLGLPEGGLTAAIARSGIGARAGNGEITADEAWRRVAELFGLDRGCGPTLQADFHRGEVLNQALVTFVHSLRPRFRIALLSNAWSDARRRLTAQFSLGDLADLIMISAEEGLSKPDARLYRRTAERLGVHLTQCLFVDNNPAHVVAAERVGMHVVLFRETEQAIAEISAALAASPPVS